MNRIGLFLGIEPRWGGAFQYNQTILDALARLPSDEFEVVIGYSHKSWSGYLAGYAFENVPIPLGCWGRFFGQLLHYSHTDLDLWRRVTPFFHPSVRAFVRAECDLWIFPSQDPWCYLAPVPALATIHDLMHRYESGFPEVGNPKEFSWREWHYRNTCQWTRGILVDSTVGKRHVVESYEVDASAVHVLPYVAPSYIGENTAGNVDLKYPFPDKFIFYPAQFWEHKNHKNLIRAVGILRTRFPDIKLVLSGSPQNAYASVRQLVDHLGVEDHVVFLGYVPDNEMNALYRRARALVMPSYFGPTNIPPLEAMSIGCPAAVSNVYGMPEQTNGAALLLDPSSVENIASVIAELWEDDDLCQKLALRGKEVSSNWTKEHFSHKLISILRAALK